MDIIHILAQAPTPTPEELINGILQSAAQTNGLTVGGLIGVILLAVAIFIRYVIPAIGRRYVSNLETNAGKEVHELEQDKLEDRLSIEAKEFLTEQARESISSVRTLAEDCQEELRDMRPKLNETLLELGELRTRDEFNTKEIERLTQFQEKNTKVLVAYRNDMTDMQSQITILKDEIVRLRRRATELEQKLQISEEINARISAEYEIVRMTLVEKDRALTKVIDERDKLRSKVTEYRALKGGSTKTDTEELLSNTGGDNTKNE